MNKTKNTKRTNKGKAVELIKNSKGKFMTVTFTKKNGDERTINGNYKRPKRDNPLGYITMYSMKDKGYRTVNPQTIKSVSLDNTT